MKGSFITLEGPEGCGKSTQLDLLAKHLDDDGYPVLTTKEPGGTEIGKQLREVLLSYKTKNLCPSAELFLMLADRAQHVREVVLPALQQGYVVISDRHHDATLAYQGYGRGIDLKLLHELHHLTTAGVKPDLTILLDIDPAKGLVRAVKTKKKQSQKNKGDRFEQEDIDFHRRVRQGYLALAKAEPNRFFVLEVEGMSISKVHRLIAARVNEFFKQKES